MKFASELHLLIKISNYYLQRTRDFPRTWQFTPVCVFVRIWLINHEEETRRIERKKNEANSETSGRGGFDPQKNGDKEEEEGIKEDSCEWTVWKKEVISRTKRKK